MSHLQHSSDADATNQQHKKSSSRLNVTANFTSMVTRLKGKKASIENTITSNTGTSDTTPKDDKTEREYIPDLPQEVCDQIISYLTRSTLNLEGVIKAHLDRNDRLTLSAVVASRMMENIVVNNSTWATYRGILKINPVSLQSLARNTRYFDFQQITCAPAMHTTRRLLEIPTGNINENGETETIGTNPNVSFYFHPSTLYNKEHITKRSRSEALSLLSGRHLHGVSALAQYHFEPHTSKDYELSQDAIQHLATDQNTVLTLSVLINDVHSIASGALLGSHYPTTNLLLQAVNTDQGTQMPLSLSTNSITRAAPLTISQTAEDLAQGIYMIYKKPINVNDQEVSSFPGTVNWTIPYGILGLQAPVETDSAKSTETLKSLKEQLQRNLMGYDNSHLKIKQAEAICQNFIFTIGETKFGFRE